MTIKDLLDTGTRENLVLACQLIQGMTKDQFMAHMHEWLIDYINDRQKLKTKWFPFTHSFMSFPYYDPVLYFCVELDYNRSNRYGYGYYVAEFEWHEATTDAHGKVTKTMGGFELSINFTKANFKKGCYRQHGTMVDVKKYFSKLSQALTPDD